MGSMGCAMGSSAGGCCPSWFDVLLDAPQAVSAHLDACSSCITDAMGDTNVKSPEDRVPLRALMRASGAISTSVDCSAG